MVDPSEVIKVGLSSTFYGPVPTFTVAVILLLFLFIQMSYLNKEKKVTRISMNFF